MRKLHADTAARVASTAAAVPLDRWLTPRAEGKWSPAEIVEHLIVSYDVVLGELAGGPGMKIRTKMPVRWILRFIAMRRILAGAPFPPGVRAPMELRPAAKRPQSEALAVFRERAAQFDAAVAAAIGTGRKITHAYFGRMSLADGMLLAARHLENHLKQLGCPSSGEARAVQ